MKRYQNISLCQINVEAGKREYYFPKNANWAGKKICKIMLKASIRDFGEISPIDGSTVLNCSNFNMGDFYFDIYNDKGDNVMHYVGMSDITLDTNYPIELNHVVNLETSRILFVNNPQQAGALLFYFFYEASERPYEEPKENITVQFDVPAKQRISFQNIIEKYIYAQNKNVSAITVWNGEAYDFNTGFITLRDTTGKLAHENLPTYMLRPQRPVAGNVHFLSNRIWLDNIDLDFDNSFVFNSLSTDQHYIVTFYY